MLKKSKNLAEELLRKAKREGFSDKRIADLTKTSEEKVFEKRKEFSIHPGFLKVDTCAGEFESKTPYYYSSYWSQSSALEKNSQRILIIGSGPNRIGQGIEFDYCCVRGVKALRKLGYEAIMINSNPETVSTDYDVSNRLYFEPLHFESVMEVIHHVQPMGVVLQLGGQTPLSLVHRLAGAGVPILGSSLDTIDLAEDRSRFKDVCKDVEFLIPEAGLASHLDEALKCAGKIGYPLICRPSYVLGGRRMEVIENEKELVNYFTKYKKEIGPQTKCFMDRFLEGALEVDVDLIRGKDWSFLGGVVEHIESAGVHSGDSMGVTPPQRLKPEVLEKIKENSLKLADKMNVMGHLNVQLAVKDDQVFIIEANPRCSRTVPFLSKAKGVPLVDIGVSAMMGLDKSQVNPLDHWTPNKKNMICVKGVVFPFKKFPNADSILGPEMKSTGESMGRGQDYGEALMKAFLSSQNRLPKQGEIFLSLKDKDKPLLLSSIRELVDLGFSLSATGGTAQFLFENGVDCIPIKKVHEGRPHCVDRIRSGQVSLVINTTSGRQSLETSFSIRRSCTDFGIPCITEDHSAEALVLAIRKLKMGDFGVYSLDSLDS